MMLNTEVLWNKALTDNNIKGLIGCLGGLYTEGEVDTSERLASFNCWLQRSAELAKKELLTLCFSRYKGPWLFLDEDSVALVHKLVLKLKNLLSLIHLQKKYSGPLHAKQGSRASYKWVFWKQEHHPIRQHILLGSLVQWWSSTGLLPNHPEAHELKRISQMWRQMDQKNRRSCLGLSCYAEDEYRWSSLIQGMVAHMVRQHGPVWVSEDCAYQTYPPPSLDALLKLVLLPNVDIVSVQAIIMYFVLDVSNFLQRKNDLLQSFCHVFNIPSTFSQQIFGFWLLDHRLVADSMDVLLSPRAYPPTLSWNHCAVLRTLLRTGENRAALKYLYRITPAMENIHDIQLCLDVLIHNKFLYEAWALLKGLQTEDVHLFKHFIQVSENCGISRNIVATLCQGMAYLHLMERQNAESDEAPIQDQETIVQPAVRTEPAQSPRPLSAWLNQTDESLSPGDLVRILRLSISEIRPPPKKRVVMFRPVYFEPEKSLELLPSSSCHFGKGSSVDIHHENEAAEEECDEDLLLHTEEEMCDLLPVFSSASTSPDSMESIGFFRSACSSPSALCAESTPTHKSIHIKQSSFTVAEDESVADLISACPDVTLTLEGTTEVLSINCLSRERIERIFSSVVPGDISHSSEEDAIEATHPERRLMSTLNLHPHYYSNEDNQSVCSVTEIPRDSNNLLSPNHEKLNYQKTVDDVVIIKSKNLSKTEEWVISASELKPEWDQEQDCESVETSGTCSFLELKPLKRAPSLLRVNECQEGFLHESDDTVEQPEILTSCGFTDTMQDLLAPLQQFDDGEPYQTSSLTASKSTIMDTDLSLIHLSQRPHHLQNPSVSSSSRACRLPLSVPSECRFRSSSESRLSGSKETMCFRSSSERVGHCKLGSWWKQALETRRASTSLIPALQQNAPVTRVSSTSPDLRGAQTHGPGNCLDLPTSLRVEKRELKQVVKAGSYKVAINQMDRGTTSHRGRREKTSKRVKRV